VGTRSALQVGKKQRADTQEIAKSFWRALFLWRLQLVVYLCAKSSKKVFGFIYITGSSSA
jgi:hypothetical protein